VERIQFRHDQDRKYLSLVFLAAVFSL